jgi:hypothetical protein
VATLFVFGEALVAVVFSPSSIIKKTAITIATPLQHERRRQMRGLLLLAFAVLAFSVLHAGIHNVFHPGWGHPW